MTKDADSFKENFPRAAHNMDHKMTSSLLREGAARAGSLKRISLSLIANLFLCPKDMTAPFEQCTMYTTKWSIWSDSWIMLSTI